MRHTKSEQVLAFIGESETAGVIDNETADRLESYLAGELIELPGLKLPSRYKHGQKVMHTLIDSSKVNKTEILKIHFTESTVTYDIELECYWKEGETPKADRPVREEFYYHRMYNVPSSFLIPVNI